MLGIRNQNGGYMNFFTKKLKEPTLSDYTRIKGKVTSLVTPFRVWVVNAITWFNTLQPNCAPIASWEITEEQYISIFVKNGIIDQLKIEGFKPTHLITQDDV